MPRPRARPIGPVEREVTANHLPNANESGMISAPILGHGAARGTRRTAGQFRQLAAFSLVWNATGNRRMTLPASERELLELQSVARNIARRTLNLKLSVGLREDHYHRQAVPSETQEDV
jgi:hypothetical protein